MASNEQIARDHIFHKQNCSLDSGGMDNEYCSCYFVERRDAFIKMLNKKALLLKQQEGEIARLEVALRKSKFVNESRLMDIKNELRHSASMAQHYIDELQNKAYQTDLAIKNADEALLSIQKSGIA